MCGNNQRELAAFNFSGTIAHAWSVKVGLHFEPILVRIDKVYARLAWDWGLVCGCTAVLGAHYVGMVSSTISKVERNTRKTKA